MTRLDELLTMLKESADADRFAGRFKVADEKDELIALVRNLTKRKARGFQKGNRAGTAWRGK